MKRLFATIATLVIAVTMTACGNSNVEVDYADAASFESALNSGENLEGKVVTFVAQELQPQSAYGYDIYSGEHLNFVSSRHPNVKAGDVVTVKATEISSVSGSWIIKYDIIKIEKSEDTEAQFTSNNTEEIVTDSDNNVNHSISESVISEEVTEETDNEDVKQTLVSVNTEKEEKKACEIIDYGWRGDVYDAGETAYIDFCVLVYNPNKSYMVEYPELLVTVKNSNDEIIATESHVGHIIMPEDTVPITVSVYMSMADAMEIGDIQFNIKNKKTNMYIDESKNTPKTTDFEIINVSERCSSNSTKITGEIQNNFKRDVERVKLTVIFRNDDKDKIVYFEDTYVNYLLSGGTTPFEITLGNLPEYDNVEIYAQEW